MFFPMFLALLKYFQNSFGIDCIISSICSDIGIHCFSVDVTNANANQGNER